MQTAIARVEFILVALWCMACAFLPDAAVAEPRVALVIGNGSYDSLGKLANPANDANEIASALRRAGFDVDVEINLDQKGMKRAVERLGTRLRAVGKDATGLFYYAGHGLEERGENYLVPTDAAIQSEGDIDIEGVRANAVLREMAATPDAINIVILDACRDMPDFRARGFGEHGLAVLYGPPGTFIGYSTGPGQLASDGTGANSPFALALIGEMGRQGQPITFAFNHIRQRVLAATSGRQVPWDSSSLLNEFYFVPPQTQGDKVVADNLAGSAPAFDRATAGIGMRGISIDSDQDAVFNWVDSAARSNIVTVVANRTTLHLGDSVRYHVTSQTDGFVSVFGIGPEGKVNRFYPDNDDTTTMYIRAGETKIIPGTMKIERPLGNETTLAFVSKMPLFRNRSAKLCSGLERTRVCNDFYARLLGLTKTWALIDPQTGNGDWAVGAAHYVSSER